MKIGWIIAFFGSLLLVAATLGLVSCQDPEVALPQTSEGIDKRSFDLGMIQAFAEMVASHKEAPPSRCPMI